jgi:hypothetical protein
MEQLTPSEWAKEQLKRAPAFAISTAIVTLLLLLSMFIEYAPARTQAQSLTPVEAEIALPEPEVIEEIKPDVELKEMEFKPDLNAPKVDDSVPVDAPLETDITVDVEFTEDVTAEEMEPSDPFPMELTKKMAVIGTGPGTGGFRGVLGARSAGGRRQAGRRYGMPEGTEKSILAALRWLKKAQERNGRWQSKRWGGTGDHDTGLTGLALLAFLGFGCTDDKPVEFSQTIDRSIKWLVSRQIKSGKAAGRFHTNLYNHGIATMALAEAAAMMPKRRDARVAAQGGLNYIVRMQPSHGSFSYTGPGAPAPRPDKPSSADVSVTGFQIQAIKAAQVAELNVPKQAIERTQRFLTICMNRQTGGVPYRINPTKGSQGRTDLRSTMTAATLAGRLFMGERNTSPRAKLQANFLMANNRMKTAAQRASNVYEIYYISLAMFNMGGEYWRAWNPAFNNALRAKQVKSGPEAGSWPIQGMVYSDHAGRVYTTAMACMALEVYFRFLPTYRSF